MFDQIIKFSLRNRIFVLAAAALTLVYGGTVLVRTPVDVFPDLNRPTVTIMTEAGGLSPEEVETLVARPIEIAMNGAPGVKRVRSTSGIGLSVVFVEFEWGTDIYLDRQLVAERLAVAGEQLPRDVAPVMAPISSIMGEILLVGVQSDGGETSQMEVRDLAEWVIRQQILATPGIAQVTVMGGEVRQYQVLVDPEKLLAFGVTLDAVKEAAGLSQANTTGGFLESKSQELLVRNLARSSSIDDLANTTVAYRKGVAIRLRQVAEVKLGPALKRGDGGVNGKPAVIMAIQKQPGANTIALTKDIEGTLEALQKTLPDDVKVTVLFKQATFIELAVDNVVEALRDGSILVVIVLFLFLLNFRTTAITLTAIPLSLIITIIVMDSFGISVNTMTLGGMAVAIGELVDDAIVDVENVLRRLKENRRLAQPAPTLLVVYLASTEVRNSIVFATILVILVFLPLFAMGGIEGRLFVPLGVAYITSIAASLLVSLTVTPALCSYLLGNARFMDKGDGLLVRFLKRQDRRVLDVALDHPWVTIVLAAVLVVAAASAVPLFGREFMPPFNEGTATINLLAKPGTSLEESNRLGRLAEQQILSVPEVSSVGRRTGRAEQDEHAEGVHYSEVDVDFHEEGRPREVVLAEVREKLSLIPGLSVNVGQPISHRLDHLLSGIRAQIAVKLFGDDLETLRAKAAEIQGVMADVDGIVDLQIEQQVLIPQLRIRIDPDRARTYGIRPGEMAHLLEGAFHGEVVAQVLQDQRTYDILVRYDDDARTSPLSFGRALVDTPSGATVPVAAFAEVVESAGPNVINHDNGRRRIVISANAEGRDVGSVVTEVQRRLADEVELPVGYFLSYEGQFESQQSATRLIAILSLFSLLGMFLVLYAHFRSVTIVLQVMLNVPLALIGSVAAVALTGGVLSVATLVGFITLCGIASRNTIMMISHYLHLVEEEGEEFDRAMIIRGSLERMVPVLMTALTAGLALVPLVLASGQPGKEILYPVATVILGGLVSSTLLDMVVTPAVFFKFGRKALLNYVDERKTRADVFATPPNQPQEVP